MDETLRNGLVYFLAGVAVGAAGATLLARQNSTVRGAVVGSLAQGLAVRDKVLMTLEKAKEDVEDLVAEARQTRGGDLRETDQVA